MPLFDRDIKKIQENHPQLIHLDLGGHGLLDEDISKLVEKLEHNIHITSLNLSENNIEDEGAIALAKLTRIKKLDLSRNNVSVKSAQYLAESKIEDLDVSENYLNNAAGSVFAEKSHQLKLNVSKNVDLNDEKIKSAIEAKIIKNIKDTQPKPTSSLCLPTCSVS